MSKDTYILVFILCKCHEKKNSMDKPMLCSRFNKEIIILLILDENLTFKINNLRLIKTLI